MGLIGTRRAIHLHIDHLCALYLTITCHAAKF